MMKYKKIKLKKGYSLLEVIISLGIIGILIIMLFNIMIQVVQINYKNSSRSFIREEISNILNQISKDLRNADRISSCNQNSCTLFSGGSSIKWSLCTDDLTKICKYSLKTNEISYQSNENIEFSYFNFDSNFSDNISTEKQNLIITVKASHRNQTLNITNVVKQITASTKNYEF